MKALIFLCFSIIPFAFLTNSLFLKDPLIWPDEALFFDTARTWITTGNLGSELLAGAIVGYEKHAYWTPPFYIYLLGLWTNIWGDSIEAARSLTVLLSVTSLILIFFISKSLFKGNLLSVMAVLLVSLDYWFSHTSRVARMDILSLSLLLSVLLLLLMHKKNKKLYLMLLTGVLSGLGLLTHPLGILSLVVVALFMLIVPGEFPRKFKAIGLFLIPNLLALLFWFWSMKDSLNILIIQYKLQLARKAWQTPYAVNQFQQEIIWGIIYSLDIIVVGIALLWVVKRFDREKLFILLCTIFTGLAVLWGKEAWYITYVSPFVALLIIYLLQETQKYAQQLFILIFLIAFSLLGLNIGILWQTKSQYGSSTYQYQKFTTALNEKIAPGSKVFLSAAPDPYFGLRNNTQLKLYEFSPVPLPDKTYKEFLDQSDYAVVNMNINPFLASYLNKYQDPSQSVNISGGGYSAKLIKLIPRERRF